MRPDYAIERVAACAYRVPTETPEEDGTHAWTATTLVVVHSSAGGHEGMGDSYGSAAMVPLIHELLAPRMRRAVRNAGRPGVAATAISAVDASLWDLKAKLLDLPLARLLGAVREAAPVYGSGGFTNYTLAQLSAQLGAWAQAGISRVRMKIGRTPA
jgi:L-alanine-DL-glutamate epimerase-like enolase superfamily enzyme